MEIKAGTLLEINHQRKGKFIAIAEQDFDTEKAEFYPVRVAIKNKEIVEGLVNEWLLDERIPCRASFCEIKIIKK